MNQQLVDTLNGLLSSVANANNVSSRAGPPLYYNQSGPPVPLLCNPYRADLSDRSCAAGEVPAVNAPQAWLRYMCRTTTAQPGGPEICATVGRLTPPMYVQALAVANASDGLVGYGPVLAGLTPEAFAREVLAEGLGIAHVTVGADFCFGKNRRGTADTLREMGDRFGFGVTIVPLVGAAEGEYSSTAIRTALAQACAVGPTVASDVR